jgi:soluble lytic murein transglycosylase
MAQTEDALKYLNLVIKRFPKQAGEALVEKAEILDTLQSKKLAAQTRQLLLTQYGDSEAAAAYRWKVAQERSSAKDYRGAWLWAQPIPTRNPKSILAPRAGFWVGKWAHKLGRQRDAKAAFEYVLSQFPQSYYAWRSAAMLGLDVGNFDTVRQLNPEVVPPTRSLLPAGSATLKELYQLGQDLDAGTQWLSEFQNKTQPKLAEQYTDGLMRLAKGENLKGISQVSTLEDRETPQEQVEYKVLSQQLTYWQARYPFPFLEEIETWSQKRQLNPLLVTALIRQESRFEPQIISSAGAVGLMQVMPGTSKWVAGKINLKQYNLEIPQDNIQLGTWFLDYTHREYANNSLLAVASYNAGPGNVSNWQRNLGISDPDEFVEAIPFEETKGYVRQVFGNYWNYLRLYNPEIYQLMAKYSARSPKALP